MTYLDRVNSPADVKKMTAEELKGLAADIREGILKRDSLIGGHVGPNLGFVEATLALHYVFNSPEDKIVYDVSHQCYAHKMITGRKNGFLNPDDYAKISGYTNPHESEHDHFVIGHTSTSVSLASGLAKARDLKGEKYNVIAVIGDGSLSGGEALEGLDFAGAELGTNFIVVVNDNQMSIAENHGGLYNNLKQLRESNGKAETNLFKALGYDYLYVADGNDIEALIAAFRQVKDSTKPVVVHLNTLKGKGYKPAEEHKEPWHWSVPFDVKSGEKTADFGGGENYNDLTYDFLLNKIRESDAGKGGKVAVLTAGTPGVFGFTPERRAELGSHYIDVGIAEEHAVAMASALAKGGCRPVFCVYSSFIQRTYDQLSQDLAINSNPAVILVFGAGLSPMDATHLGCFDMAMAANIPNIVYLMPATKEEYLAMLEWGMTQTERPVIIRVPGEVVSDGAAMKAEAAEVKRLNVVEKGEGVAILVVGDFLELGRQAVAKLKEKGIHATVAAVRCVSEPDEAALAELAKTHKVAVTLEDGVLDGGFGEKVARYYGATALKVLAYGGRKEFTDREPLDEIYRKNRLEPEMIAEDVLKLLEA